MKPASIILTIILVLLVIGGVALYMKNGQVTLPGNTNGGTNSGTYCTQDAMMCPDGSYVGRIAPSCNFAACPVGTATTTRTTITAGINQTVQSVGLSITPLMVVEDSRCPVDVTCIQAGRVRLNTRLASGNSSTTQILILNTPVVYGSTTVTLSEVSPAKRSTETVATSTYRFTFMLEAKK